MIKTLLSALMIISLNLFGQVAPDSLRQVVLSKDVTDSLFIFGEWNETGGTETHLKYLGIIETEAGNFKIMTSCWLWGLSKRATNRILVFTDKNEYCGNYYLTTRADLPEKIENNQLVFLHSESLTCDKNTPTRLSFEDGIPQEFFLKCKDGKGDFYSFSRY